MSNFFEEREPIKCARCASDPVEHELEDDDGGLFVFCQKCYEDFQAFMTGVI